MFDLNEAKQNDENRTKNRCAIIPQKINIRFRVVFIELVISEGSNQKLEVINFSPLFFLGALKLL
jgi:hypothetical protein